MEEQLSQLYDTVILAHNRSPFNYEKRPTAQHILDAYNPLCGDKFKLFLDIEGGIVQKATFHGYGCAVSKAATSVLVKKLQGLSNNEVKLLVQSYFEALGSENTEGGDKNELDEEIQAFSAVQQFPERLTCATLSWEAAKAFFEK
jgi:nitrogen fixation protein NifU and related proteins